MAMGRNTRGDKEYSRLQEVLHENRKLKKEISSLRKQLGRLDLDRHSYVREIVDEHLTKQDQEISTKQMLNSLKNEWACRECGNGYLEIYLYTRRDGTFYVRQCNNCAHRTRSQRHTPEVRGIIKIDEDPSK
jgi:hypothetical protein